VTSGMLAQALAVLEAGQEARTVSAPLRLAASALYGLLGAPHAAAASLAALHVKNIQVDTVTGRGPSGLRVQVSAGCWSCALSYVPRLMLKINTLLNIHMLPTS